MANPKVLILYASYGDGHLQVSRALKEALSEREIEAVMIDLMALSHPFLDAFCRRFYRKSYSVFPHLYGWLYGSTNRLHAGNLVLQWVNSFGRKVLLTLIDQEKPDLLLNTFPMPSLPNTHNGRYPVPISTVLTDFTAHSRWLHKRNSAYYVATHELAKELRDRGIAPEKLKVCGIPTMANFRRPVGCDRIYNRFGLSSRKKTLLIMAGSYGVLKGLERLDPVLLSLHDLQIVFICGNNRSLTEKLKQAYHWAHNVHVFGYVEDIPMLMAISFGLVTKPGGVTISEALTANLPCIFYRPVPGQEMANADYLASKGAAMIAYSGEDLSLFILRLLRDGELRRHMCDSISRLRHPRSAEAIAQDIAEHLHSGQWPTGPQETSASGLFRT
ncbi:MGDG synthase family glycosyltransferase [Gorillibacterium timonense]|uniref:MGDG synthase family glycosyltransferase n=1 Tax=Gorillibacterium timonense TaxID=1689269 RepID=UPI00071E47FE|nr:glycosyltransferase [Gorillibacterium timonense]